MSPSPFAPKRIRWFYGAAGAAAGTTLLYLVLASMSPWRPGRFWGLAFGAAAATLFVNAALYPARRRLGAKPWRTAQDWLQLHIYGGFLGTWCVFIHVGFRLPAGQLGWWLWGLSLWTTLTGLLGVAIQKWLPPMMTRSLRVEAIYERIPDLVARRLARADELIRGAPEMLARVYSNDLRPLLATSAPRWAYVTDPVREYDRRLAPLSGLRRYVAGADRERLTDLEAIVREKLELDAHLSAQRALRTWLLLHIPAAYLLLGLLAVHIGAVLVF